MHYSTLLDEFRTLLARNGQTWRENREGIALEFRDGCDALFIAEDTVNELLGPDVDELDQQSAAQRIVDEFQRLDQTRWQVLLALRHHAAKLKWALDRRPDGSWTLQSDCGATSEICVGSQLTRLAGRHDPAGALEELLKFTLLRKPSSRRIEKLLAMTEPPEQERGWQSDEEVSSSFDPTGWLAIDWRALGDKQLASKSPEEVADALTGNRDSPGLAVVRRLNEELALRAELVSVDACNLSRIDFDYSDEMDRMRVTPGGKRISRLIEQLGVEAVVARLAEEYRQTDRARSKILNGLNTLMASHGFARDDFGDHGEWWFGKTHREFHFDAGKSLTRKLKKQSPADVLADWLARTEPFPCPATEELDAVIDGPAQEPAERTLPTDPPGTGPRLPSIGELDFAELDRRAVELIERIKSKAARPGKNRHLYSQDPLCWWSDPRWYRRGHDCWTDETWWLAIAERAWLQNQHQQAAMILIVNGDDRPRKPLLKLLSKLPGYHHEACHDGIVWLLRSELPWPIEDDYMPEYPAVLGSPPPRLARRLAMGARGSIQAAARGDDPDTTEAEHLFDALEAAASLDMLSAAEWLDPSEIELLHQHCRRWAASSNFLEIREESPLTAAAHFEWTDVADILDDNPAFVPAILESHMYRLRVGALAQRVTLVSAGSLAARLAARAMTMDVETEVHAVAEEESRSPGNEKFVPLILKGVKKGVQLAQLEGAVAWTRCRQAGLAEA